MRTRPLALLALVAMLFAGPIAHTRFAPPNKLYRDAAHKFSLKIFKEWEQVPVEAGQKIVVAKFHEPGETRRVPTEIEIYRVDLSNQGTDGPITGGDGKRPTDEQLKEYAERLMAPKDVYSAMTRYLPLPAGQKVPNKEKDGKPTDSADKVPGLLYTFEVNLLADQKVTSAEAKDLTFFAVLATFKKDNVEYGIKAIGPSRDRKSLEGDFKSVVKSFRCFDENAGEVESLSVLDGLKISPKRRAEIEASMIKDWKVLVSSKKNYAVVYNTQKGKNTLLAKAIAERIEKIREKVYEVQFPPAHPIEAVSIVRVCKDRSEYFAYGGPQGSAGYWNSGTEELVFYDMSPSKKIDDNTLAVLYHEAFHQYIYYSVGNVAPHSWFNEGHGDYYAGTRYAGSSVKVDPFKWRVGTVKNAIRQGPRTKTVTKDPESGKETVAWGDTGYTPLQDLVRFTQRDYYAYPGVSYAQGWSIVYFLREIVPKNKAMNAKWGNILKTYFDVLQREVNKTGQLKRGGVDSDPTPPKPPGPDAPGGEDGKPAPGEDPAKPEDPGAGPDDGPGNPPGGDDDPEVDPGLQPEQEGVSTPSALQLAVDEAFKGIDWAEFEKAWRDAILKIGG